MYGAKPTTQLQPVPSLSYLHSPKCLLGLAIRLTHALHFAGGPAEQLPIPSFVIPDRPPVLRTEQLYSHQMQVRDILNRGIFTKISTPSYFC
jgi:hypothetical protein